jgi:hypothetical protein
LAGRSDAGRADLKVLSRLVMLSVQHTKITDVGVSALKRERSRRQAQ